MRLLFIATAVLAIGFSSGCTAVFQSTPGSGVAATETRTVEDFHAIQCSGTSNVFVTVGGEQSVSVTFDDNLLEIVRTEVSDGKLRISTDGNYSSSIGMKVEISVPSLDEVIASGVSEINVDNASSPKFNVTVSGVGKAKIVGEVDQLDVSASGTSSAKLADLKAKLVTVDTSGTSGAEVFATDSVDADASGTSNISVFGNPTSFEKDTSGVANIEIVE